MSKYITVVTNVEMGWDCVLGAYESSEVAQQHHDSDEYTHFHNIKLNCDINEISKEVLIEDEEDEDDEYDKDKVLIISRDTVADMATICGINHEPYYVSDGGAMNHDTIVDEGLEKKIDFVYVVVENQYNDFSCWIIIKKDDKIYGKHFETLERIDQDAAYINIAGLNAQTKFKFERFYGEHHNLYFKNAKLK
jgi:hypothetical protein